MVPRLDQTVGVVSSDEVNRRRIAAILVHEGLAVSFESSTTDDLAAERTHHTAHAVVITADHADHVEVVRAVHSQLPETRIVIVSSRIERHIIRKTIDAGADGLVVDSALDDALGPAVRAVCAGQLSIPRDLRAQLVKPALSAREKQVLGMVVMGFANAEIAGKLFLAESTVKSHLSSAFAKLGVRSRSEAAALILDPDQELSPGILAISQMPSRERQEA